MTCKNIYPELQEWIIQSTSYREKEKRLEHEVSQAGNLCLSEFYLLYYLETCPMEKIRIQDAQEKIRMSQSAMSRLVQRLENMNPPLVYRTICEEDKRAVYIHITDAGRETYLKTADATRGILTGKDK